MGYIDNYFGWNLLILRPTFNPSLGIAIIARIIIISINS